MALQGSISLTILYDIPHYEEDLDFALKLQPEANGFHTYLQRMADSFLLKRMSLMNSLTRRRQSHSLYAFSGFAS